MITFPIEVDFLMEKKKLYKKKDWQVYKSAVVLYNTNTSPGIYRTLTKSLTHISQFPFYTNNMDVKNSIHFFLNPYTISSSFVWN